MLLVLAVPDACVGHDGAGPVDGPVDPGRRRGGTTMSELTRPGCPSSRNVDGHSHDYRLHIHTGGGPIGAAVPLPEKDAEIARLRAENETLRRQAADDLSRLGQEM